MFQAQEESVSLMPVNGAATGFDCLKVVQVTRPALTVACRSSLYGHCPAHPPVDAKKIFRIDDAKACLYELCFCKTIQ
ncbi:hypothetical protein E2C01_010019 [Portunus trituberculatus]|uniref:Uncharacterized protein n=1 Tax=Portunus trituberculatus TaxID=210409 RepID=A0A5B7D795_PORTR|nr:hypothetical protein [Portunus trituberculatus]